MKKITYCLICLSVCFLFGCGNGNEKKGVNNIASTVQKAANDSTITIETDTIEDIISRHCVTQPGNGMANFIIQSATASTMITHFDETYGKYTTGSVITAFKRKYWIDKCTIYMLEDFLKKTARYDGVRFYFGAAAKTNPVYDPPYQSETSIYINPTVLLNNKHHDSFDQIVSNVCTTGLSYLTPHSSTSTPIAVFNNVYHNHPPTPPNPKYSLSNGVWIDSCVIYFVADLLRAYPLIDGFNINTAAYLGNEINVPNGMQAGQEYSTIIFSITSFNKSTQQHKEEREISDTIYNAFKNYVVKNNLLGTRKSFDLYLNHGELCPNACGN
jgi:hypothetical protein